MSVQEFCCWFPKVELDVKSNDCLETLTGTRELQPQSCRQERMAVCRGDAAVLKSAPQTICRAPVRQAEKPNKRKL